MNKVNIAFFIAIPVFLQACGGCTDHTEPGVVVIPYTQRSGEPICGVEVMLIDGDYVESKTSDDDAACLEHDAQLQMAFEREGNYQVVVSKDGYKTWTSDEIAVISDRCHVIRHDIEVYLEQN